MLYLFPSPTIGDSLGHLSLGKGSIRNLKPKLGMPDNLFLIQSNGLKTKRSNNEKNLQSQNFLILCKNWRARKRKKSKILLFERIDFFVGFIKSDIFQVLNGGTYLPTYVGALPWLALTVGASVRSHLSSEWRKKILFSMLNGEHKTDRQTSFGGLQSLGNFNL